MASVFVLLEAFNRKEAAALGFFPCATASFFCLRGKLPIHSALRTGVGGIAGNTCGTCKKNSDEG